MRKPKKKLEGVDANTRVSDAARRTLEARLAFVAEMIELAGREKGDDVLVEHVHQLRVSTRRAGAAIDAFRPCLEKKSGKLRKKARAMRKRLKRIRKAAGEARDCDVHLQRFTAKMEHMDEEQRPVLEHLIRTTGSQRDKAIKDIRKIRRKNPRRRLLRRAGELVKTIRPPAGAVEEPSLIEHARGATPVLVQSVHEGAEADLSNLESLHELRIRLKRLRYALEVFAPCFEKQHRKAFQAMLKSIQDHLGTVNDDDTIIARIERTIDAAAAEGAEEQLIADLRLLADRQRFERDRRRDEFLAWWNEFDRSAFFASLDRMLQPADGVSAADGVSSHRDNGSPPPPDAIGVDARPRLPTEREHST